MHLKTSLESDTNPLPQIHAIRPYASRAHTDILLNVASYLDHAETDAVEIASDRLGDADDQRRERGTRRSVAERLVRIYVRVD
jgi:hypothetical protein